MKILIVGLGSIGTRHLNNILLLGFKNVSIVSRRGTLPDIYGQLEVFKTVEDAVNNKKFDTAIVCTPTAYHLTTLNPLLEAGIKNIYLEKPVSHTLEGIDALLSTSRERGARIIVGYDLHFDPGLLKVKDLLALKEIGQVVSANAQVGQYLPDWRPQEDYRTGMSAKKATGGGVMLDLIHEFDYLYWLFGDISHIGCFNKNSGALDIETEDIAEVLLKFSNGLIGSIHLDYLQQKLVRNCFITGSEGSIFWNLALCEVKWINAEKAEQSFNYSSFNRNDRFVSIMNAFLNDPDDKRLTSLQQGIESLKMVVAAKRASIEEQIVKLDNVTLQ